LIGTEGCYGKGDILNIFCVCFFRGGDDDLVSEGVNGRACLGFGLRGGGILR